MPTRKQRRRREKEKRHDYEVVYLDAAGNEVEPPPGEPSRNGSSSKAAAPKQAARGGRGAPQPPSWRRALKRGLIFAPIFLAVLLLLSGERLGLTGAIVQTVVLFAIFVPFSYFMDRFFWRMFQRRQARS